VQPDDFLYEAERVVHVCRYPCRLSTEGEARDLLDSVVGSRWFQNRWPKVAKRPPALFASNHASAWADFDKNRIYLPAWASNDFTLLHELAHFCAGLKDNHGPIFVDAHLQLVSRFMGKDAASCFRHALRAVGR